MVRKLIYAIVIWIVVAIALGILGRLLIAVGEDLTSRIGNFLQDVAVVVGFLAAIWYFFFGSDTVGPRL